MTPAKLLLFGEHTVLHGGEALAVPLRKFGAAWAGGPAPGQRFFEEWLTYAGNVDWLDLAKWRAEASTLAVESDIPQNYGLGSSGALTALVYGRYATPDRDTVQLTLLRERLAFLEGYFHGRSSGLDPLVCYLQQAIHIRADATVSLVAAPATSGVGQGQGRWFLLDSRQPKAGRAAIARFGESCKEDGFRQNYLAPSLELTAALIAGVTDRTAKETSAFRQNLERLSELQLEHLKWLIPEGVAAKWRVWWEADVACLKLCGAGGGGTSWGMLMSQRAWTAQSFGCECLSS